MKKLVVVLIALAVVIASVYFYYRSTLATELELAKTAKAEKDWTRVRIHASRDVQRFPKDSDALLLLAEAHVKDQAADSKTSIDHAIELLGRIDFRDSNCSVARLRQAQLLFLEQGKAYRAEKKVRRAIELDSKSKEAHELLWRILAATNRTFECEEAFIGVLNNCKNEEKADVLRNWFNSQYVRHKFNYPVDSMMGILAPNQQPNDRSELDRLVILRNSEPASAQAIGAVALWMQRHSDSKSALELLTPSLDSEISYESTLFVNSLVSVYFDAGEFEKAKAALERWPENKKDQFYYLQWKGILAQDVDKDYAKAIEFYEQSTKVWPGQSDVTVHFRMARCLERTGQNSEAESANARVKELEKLMHPDNLRDIQTCLGDLENVQNIQKLSDFYARLNRPLESSEWQKLMNQ